LTFSVSTKNPSIDSKRFTGVGLTTTIFFVETEKMAANIVPVIQLKLRLLMPKQKKFSGDIKDERP